MRPLRDFRGLTGGLETLLPDGDIGQGHHLAVVLAKRQESGAGVVGHRDRAQALRPAMSGSDGNDARLKIHVAPPDECLRRLFRGEEAAHAPVADTICRDQRF